MKKKISENTKITLTIKQLKKLVNESIPDRMDVKNEALKFFVDKINNGDIYGEFYGGT